MSEGKQKAPARSQALYRKYRSKSLDEVIGQDHITKTLSNALKQGKISHAYLFTGPRGTGKTSVARILAHEINSLPYQDDTPHLDIIEIDAASNRRIDDIRELRERIHIAPVSAKHKVYIIDEVHMLTTESFNALLKTLEEPPEHAIFILATTEVHKLPATIISRSQRHSFQLIPLEKIAAHLKHISEKEGITIDDGALELLAKHGGGSFRDSISLLDQIGSSGTKVDKDLVELVLGLAPEDSLLQILQNIESGEVAAVMQSLEDLLHAGITAAGAAKQLSNLIRQQLKNGQARQNYLQLFNELLQVNSAPFAELKLESALISAALANQTEVRITPAAKPSAHIPKKTQPTIEVTVEPEATPSQPPEPELQPEPKQNEPAPETLEPKSSPKSKGEPAKPDEILKKWPEILQACRQTNNALYTILRLAKPEIKDDQLTISFGFLFHKKRLEDVKNLTQLQAIIKELVGNGVDINVEHVAELANAPHEPAPETPPDSAQASQIEAIQAMMGGGEVIDG